MGDTDVVRNIHRLIVFDLDGTLIDSRQDLADTANALILELGGQALSTAAISAMVGEGAAVLVQRALTAAGLTDPGDAVRRFLSLYDDRLLVNTRPYDGMVQVLASLSHEARLAVLTNKPTSPTKAVLDGLGLSSFFETVLGGDGAFPRKPDPAALRHLVATHHVDARDAVLVGDSRIDFETARAAGTDICMARYGFGYETFPVSSLTGAEALADRPSEIPAALAAIRNSGGTGHAPRA